MDNFFVRKAKIVSYIEEEWELLPEEAHVVTLRTDNDYIRDIPRDSVNKILNVMIETDGTISILGMQTIKNPDATETDIYTIGIQNGFTPSYAAAIRNNAEPNDEIALKLELGEDEEIFLTGAELHDRKYNIMDTNRSKKVKDLFVGLLKHTAEIQNLNPIKKDTYKLETILKPTTVTIDKELVTEYDELYLPEHVQKFTKRFFQKIYKHFIVKNKNGTIIFKPAITYKELKRIKEELGEKNYTMMFTKVLQESFYPEEFSS